MSRSFYETVDAAPFVGKFGIRESIQKYILADQATEKKQFAKTSAYLGAMVAAHACQAYLGYEAATTHAEHFQNTEDASDLLLTGVDSMYAFVTASVSLRQIALMKRVATIRKQKHGQPKEMTENAKKNPRLLSQNGYAAALAITLAGQAVFIGSAVDAHAKEYSSECAAFSSETYDLYVNENPDVEYVPKDMYIEEVCAVS